MDNFAQNTCYDNVCRAMDYVAKSYVYGNQVSGTERGKGNSTYAIDYAVDRIMNIQILVLGYLHCQQALF